MPRTPLAFVLAAPHSGGGKTTASLALAVALGRLGYTVHGCKCGPDYVDPTFMSQACGHPCLNLDTWLMGEEGVRNVFQRQAEGADIVLIEGVMGLLDGRDPESLAGSTLDVARVLGLPVVLVVRARGLARSIAPLVDGFTRACAAESVRLAGVIATCTGSDSHRRVLQGSLEHNNLPPLLLSLQRNDDLALPSRQLGLVPAEEVSSFAATLQRLGEALPQKDVQAFVDYLQGLPQPDDGRPSLQQSATQCADVQKEAATASSPLLKTSPGRLAIARDEAFCFYYEENFRLFQKLGWELIFFSPMRDRDLPAAEALYLGGGYPEVFARELSANKGMCSQIHKAAQEGLPIYAECGGYMYLAKALETPEGDIFPLAGVVDGLARMGTSLHSLGYREATFLTPLPFGLDAFSPDGRVVRGHEFHWSGMELSGNLPPLYSMTDRKGESVTAGVLTGPCNNVQASYLHAYFPSLAFLNGRHKTDQAPGQGLEESAPLALSRENTGKQARPSGGHVIVLTGPSSVGKTSLGRALARELGTRNIDHVLISLDGLLASFRRDNHACFTLEEAEKQGMWSAHSYHCLLKEAAKSSSLVICDHVLCGRRDWIEDLRATLGETSVIPVELSCAEETLILREINRTDRPAATEHALVQARAQKNNRLPLAGTTQLSSQEENPLQLCQELMQLLAQRHILSV